MSLRGKATLFTVQTVKDRVFHVVSPGAASAANKSADDLACPQVEVALKEVAHDDKEVPEIDVVEGVESEIQSTGADLPVMMPHKLTLWENLFNRSTTRAIAMRTHIPLLVLPNGKREGFHRENEPEGAVFF